MGRYLIYLSYIGTKYRGVQRQYNRNINCTDTIQGICETALKHLQPLSEPIMTFSSRTDKGVHALLNTAHCDLIPGKNPDTSYPPYIITEVLNRYFFKMDHDISIIKTKAVPNAFNARKNALFRIYKYRIATPRCKVPINSILKNCSNFLPIYEKNRCEFFIDPIDFDKIPKALSLFSGSHDFASFTCKSDKDYISKSTVKFIEDFTFGPSKGIFNSEKIDTWEFSIKSKSFLYKQVRKLVGAVISYVQGKVTLDELKWMLDNPSFLNWNHKIKTLPPYGLYLTEVKYHPEVVTDNLIR